MKKMTRALPQLGSESGVAMVIAVIMSSVVATLAVLLLTVGTHTDQSTARGRHFVQSLHVAESGIEEAIARIEEADGNLASTTFSTSTELGDFDVTITQQDRNRYIVESVGGVRRGAQLGSERKIRAFIEPPLSFDKALFSDTTVEVKANDVIDGDIWANHNVILQNGSLVKGSLVAATGYVILQNNAKVEEDVISGGFDPLTNKAISMRPLSRIDGDATAAVVNIGCTGADNAVYKVNLEGGAVIAGDVDTWGNVTGSGSVLGLITANVCTQAPATDSLPGFTYNSSNYPTATHHEYGTPGSPSSTAVSDFQAYVNAQGKNIQGSFYINQSDPVSQSTRVDLTGVTITGDVTIITNTPVFTNGTDDDGVASDAVFTLISTYQPPTGSSCDVNNDNSECSVHLKNNFSTSGKTAVLIYTPFGPTAVKNNASQFGSIYADSIQVKNNQTITYDERVARVVGFGEVTLEVTDWQELSA